MPKSQLYQKVSLAKPLYIILFCFTAFACAKQMQTLHPQKTFTLPTPPGQKGKFQVVAYDTHIILLGLKDSETEETIPLLFDTGSDVSFLAEEYHPKVRTLFWAGEVYQFAVKKGILPPGIEGILGSDFFKQTCIWWDGDQFTVYDWQSSVCQRPEAYFSTALKLLVTQKKQAFYYIKHLKDGKSYWSLADTGASLSILPDSYQEGAESLGMKKVFYAGGSIHEIPLFYAKGPLSFETSQGNTVSFFDFSFLGGISLEKLELPREKDREGVWVIGLQILGRVPLFWDFERNRIGLYTQTLNIH